MTRVPIPPPGPALPFVAWTHALVGDLRTYLPGVTAARRGNRATLRYQGLCVTIDDERGTFVIRLHGDGTAMMTSLFDAHRHDWFTAQNFARTIAGHFDAQVSTSTGARDAR